MLQRSRPARLLHTLTGRHVTRCADSPWQSSPEKHIAPCLAHRTGSDIFYFIYNGKTNLNSSIGEFLKHEPFCTESQLVVGYILIFFKSIGTLEIRIRNLSLPFLLLIRHRCSDFFIRWKPESMWRKSTRSIGEVDLSRDEQWSISQGKIIKNCVNVIRRRIWGYVLFRSELCLRFTRSMQSRAGVMMQLGFISV